jgi:UDP-GlcNAc:undecaprenyl-phosphate GlcNAc-1-phosphate transferase
MQLIGISVLVFSLTVMLLVLLRVPALKVGWVDIPGGRKQHEGRVPLVGGLAMFFALMLASLVGLFSWSAYYNGFLIGALVLLVSGLFDDRFDIPPLTKLIAQGLAAWCLIGTGEFTSGLGDLLGSGPIAPGWIGLPMAIFAVVGLINAMNFFDGLDGLAAGMGLLTLIALTLVASVTNQIQILPMLIACLAAVAGFWVFNMRFHERQPAFVFMGNAGSMVLGFTLAWFSLQLTQTADAVLPPVYALWFLALPLIESVSLIARRILARKNPFQAGRDHLHHLLLAAGLGHAATVWLLLLAQAILTGVGYACWRAGASEALMFSAFIGLFLVHHAVLTHDTIRPVWLDDRREACGRSL